ncbi:hypothetical protein J7T55_009493 [Diaporthe amygdali]|uniref:uncharacterized protein n=1 Tax=Phomopsis amygdali TaxID=1214568 RepID=UPI0022FF0D21|nr:uncharacterized protein J7T55_009493 [Diaporthe amygdali]KAJ0100682.1 hypothetical protein J7T55_009493 [Diaporthe amygdali]
MDEAPIPREIKLYLSTGSFLNATRLPGEMADDEWAHYKIQCRGQDHILPKLVNTIRDDLERSILLRMTYLEGENPTMKLHGFLQGPGRPRARQEQRDWCHCSEALWWPSPFIECAGMPAYNPVEAHVERFQGQFAEKNQSKGQSESTRDGEGCGRIIKVASWKFPQKTIISYADTVQKVTVAPSVTLRTKYRSEPVVWNRGDLTGFRAKTDHSQVTKCIAVTRL